MNVYLAELILVRRSFLLAKILDSELLFDLHPYSDSPQADSRERLARKDTVAHHPETRCNGGSLISKEVGLGKASHPAHLPFGKVLE